MQVFLYTHNQQIIVGRNKQYEKNGDYEIVKNFYIDYEVNGKKYERILSPVQNNDLKIGDTVEILYQSGNPKEVASPDIGSIAAIFIIVGSVVTFGTIAFLVFMFIKERK